MNSLFPLAFRTECLFYFAVMGQAITVVLAGPGIKVLKVQTGVTKIKYDGFRVQNDRLRQLTMNGHRRPDRMIVIELFARRCEPR